MNDVMPGCDGPENLKILKKRSWKVVIETCSRQLCSLPFRKTIESLPLGHRKLSSLPWSRVVGVSTLRHTVKFFGSRPAKMN